MATAGTWGEDGLPNLILTRAVKAHTLQFPYLLRLQKLPYNEQPGLAPERLGSQDHGACLVVGFLLALLGF